MSVLRTTREVAVIVDDVADPFLPFRAAQAHAIAEAGAYPADRYAGRGVVICAGGPRYFTCAWVCINMLRRAGCALPIQVWHLGPDEMDDDMRRLLTPLGVECVDAHAVRRLHPSRRLGGWECKPYAILHSPFREVVLLDADNVPVADPAAFLDAEAYARHGAVFWPDMDRLSPDAAIWDICGVPYRDEPAFESGQVVVDKARCWTALRLAMHLNEHSDFYYRHVNGDKETFHLAWRRLDQAYGMPPFRPRVIRRGRGGPADHALAFVQHDFAGRPAFQHRIGTKWILHGRNARVPGLPRQEECLALLDDLRARWSGKVARTTPLVPPVTEAARGRWFVYHRLSADERLLQLLPDQRVGQGGSECERSWRRVEADGGERLELLGAGFLTCRLTRDADGVFRGRWLCFEEMPVELTPVATIPQAPARPAPSPERVDAVCIGAGRDGGASLRYALRSLAAHAPWIGRLHLVTPEPPAWLDTSSGRVSVVAPSGVGADDDRTILRRLHRVPGLSRQFLLLPDGCFLGHDVSPDDFLTPAGGATIFVEGARRRGTTGGRRTLARVPQLLDAAVLADLDAAGLDPMVHYARRVLDSSDDRRRVRLRALSPRAADWHVVSLVDDVAIAAAALHAIGGTRPKVFGLSGGEGATPALRGLVHAFLEWYFPQPSGFERRAA
jgi:hypothetical protein